MRANSIVKQKLGYIRHNDDVMKSIWGPRQDRSNSVTGGGNKAASDVDTSNSIFEGFNKQYWSFDGCKGFTPLHLASSNGHQAIVEALIKAGADKDAKNNSGCTPLHWASRNGQPAVEDFLIKAGADKEAKDKCGCTPLHKASAYDHEAVVNILINAGVNKEAKDEDGKMAIDLAKSNNNKNIEKLLIGVKQASKLSSFLSSLSSSPPSVTAATATATATGPYLSTSTTATGPSLSTSTGPFSSSSSSSSSSTTSSSSSSSSSVASPPTTSSPPPPPPTTTTTEQHAIYNKLLCDACRMGDLTEYDRLVGLGADINSFDELYEIPPFLQLLYDSGLAYQFKDPDTSKPIGESLVPALLVSWPRHSRIWCFRHEEPQYCYRHH